MASSRPLEKTKHPGIYKRGDRYVVRFRDPAGRSRKAFARTLQEAKDLQASKRTDISRGEYRAQSKVLFGDYALQWVESYVGRTSRGIRPATRDDYRRRLEADAIPFFGRMRLAEIEPGDLRAFVTHVGKRGVAQNTVRLSVAPVRALLATALEDRLIRQNPAAGLRLFAARDAGDADADVNEAAGREDVKALSEPELAALLSQLPAEWRTFFEFLAQTGLRIGEAIELRWGRDVILGDKP
jgi:integrase